MRPFRFTLAAAFVLVGCGSDPMKSPGEAAMPENKPVLAARTPLTEIPTECRGFEVAGLTQSPGGDVLPNTCAPFDGTYNNPFAIRCVDADPSYKTPFRGDEFCILPPPAEHGMQVHIGPNNYDDPAQLAPFLLEPGQEVNNNYFIKSSNDDTRYYYRTNWRMRDGSHHMIVTMLNDDRDDGWDPMAESIATAFGLGGTSFGGAQRTDADRPSGTLAIPPENAGIGGQMRGKQQFAFNLHHMNRFDDTILREVWMNVWYLDASQVDRKIQGMALIGNPADVSIPDGVHRTLHYKSTVTGNPRIISMFGHRHASTDRFAIWIERASGEHVTAYESFTYTDMPVYQYDSISQNPTPDVASRVDGGFSGLLELSAGDQLHFLCDINNQSGGPLKFANELLTGEMCITFGSTAGDGGLNLPTRVAD